MHKVTHGVYLLCGYVWAFIFFLWYSARDIFFPPTEGAICFVAHPDDDVLFFHSFIKEKKPYVVLMSTGWSMIRAKEFRCAMRAYGVRCFVYPTKHERCNMEHTVKHVKTRLRKGRFNLVATHGIEGEYGHEFHKRVSQAVAFCIEGEMLLNVANKEEIQKYPLDQAKLDEKKRFFCKYYKEEAYILQPLSIWLACEHLSQII